MENEIIINWVTYVKKEETQKKDDWWADKVYFVDTNGSVGWSLKTDIESYKPYCFPTEQEALKASEKMLALYIIRKYAENTWGKFIPDLTDRSQKKYFIKYQHKGSEFESDFYYSTLFANTFYLQEERHCQEIIKKFDNELRIIFDI